MNLLIIYQNPLKLSAKKTFLLNLKAPAGKFVKECVPLKVSDQLYDMNCIIRTKYAISYYTMHTVHILQTIRSIWFSFQIPLQPGKVNSCLSTITSLFKQRFFCFFVFTGCFSVSLFRFKLIFVSFGYVSLVLLQFYFARQTNNNFRFFPKSFCKINYLVTFK